MPASATEGPATGCSRPSAYAAEQLAGRGESDELAARHATWVVRLAQAHWIEMGGGTSSRDLLTFRREADNARAAHSWTVERAEAGDAQWIASAFAQAWHDFGAAPEGLQRCEEALAIAGDEPDPLVACLCHGAAVRCLHWAGQSSWPHCLAALELSERLDGFLDVWVWVTLTMVAATLDAPDGPSFETCLARAREVIETEGQRAFLLLVEGQYHVRCGRPEEAGPVLDQAMGSLAHPDLQAWCGLASTVNGYLLTGDLALTAADVDWLSEGDTARRPVVLGLQAMAAAIRGEPARPILAHAIDAARRVGWSERSLLGTAAGAAAERGDDATAARLLGAAGASTAADWVSVALAQRLTPLVRERLGSDVFDELIVEGEQLDDAAAVELALSIP